MVRVVYPARLSGFSRFDRLPLWQEIAIHLLKGYPIAFISSISASSKRRSGVSGLTPTDDLVLKEYQFLVKKSEKATHSTASKSSARSSETVSSRRLSFDKLEIFQANHHLYQPLIHLSHGDGKESLIKVVPTHLNEGEKQFVNDLEAFCKAEAKGMLAETSNFTFCATTTRTRQSAFSPRAGFRPDFILWLLKDNTSDHCFLDPKGLRNFTDNFNNPKVQFFRRIKELQALLKRDDIRLESFLLSQTYRHELRWSSPSSPDRQATPSEYRSHHILCAKDEPAGYVKDLVGMLQSD